MIHTKPVLISRQPAACRLKEPGSQVNQQESDIFTMKKGKKEKNTIKSLKELCMVNYLDNLETACSGFIQLALLDNPFLRSMVKSILPTLKSHLDTQLPPFSNDRDDLLKMALSGR